MTGLMIPNFRSPIFKAGLTLSIFLIIVVNIIALPFFRERYQQFKTKDHSSEPLVLFGGEDHKIRQLIQSNWQSYSTLVNSQSKNTYEAVFNYKQRYKRDPPPGFEKWVKYAISKGSLIIDDYDTIEKVLAPYREFSPRKLKLRIRSTKRDAVRFESIHVVNGTLSTEVGALAGLIKEFAHDLPDLEFLLNHLDEARIIGSDTSEEIIKFNALGRVDNWDKLTANCGNSLKKAKKPPRYVENPNDSIDICKNPAYHTQYGMFTSPCTFDGTEQLTPFFSVSKISTMRDILIPSPAYHEGAYFGTEIDKHNFSSKSNKLYWRGSSTGTYASPRMDWKTNHRIRFMLKTMNNTDLFDVAMTNYIQCDVMICQEMESTFGKPPRADKDESFNYKFVMDMDGNGLSGRYYRLLHTNSVVFKQTLMEQWHDDRLIPWVHYVPVSIGLDEIEDLMEYFTGRGLKLAGKIANESTEWAKRVLRPVDMSIYLYRLLLEYAELLRED